MVYHGILKIEVFMVKENKDNLIEEEIIKKKKQSKNVSKTSNTKTNTKKSNTSSKSNNKNTNIKKNNVSSNNKTNVKKSNNSSNTKSIKSSSTKGKADLNNNTNRNVAKNRKTNNDKNKNTEIIEEELLVKKKEQNKKEISNNKDDSKKKKIIVPEEEILIEETHKKKHLKIRLWVKVVLVLVILLVITILGYNYFKMVKEEKIIKERLAITEKIKKHYNEFVKLTEDTIIYRIDDSGNYYEYGTIYKNTEVLLEEIEINYLTEYFYSKDLDGYLKYSDVKPIDELTVYDNRYQKYIPFNQNIVTNDEFTLYDEEEKIYSFKESKTFPIIIKDYDNKYYVEFNNRLLYILKDDIKEIVNANNNSLKNASKVTTLCYHRVYDTNEKCNDLYICKKKSNFDKEMKYLKDNNFLTLTMEEMYLYLSKKIQVPKNSVVITLDDGYLLKSAIDVLEKYQINATAFIKTGSFTDFTQFASDYLELQSHTDKMHVSGTCPRELSYQQGGGILCLSETHILNDLKTSRDKLNGAIALAYPFYDYNQRAINLVKQSGFKLAFIGASTTNGRSYPGINLYKVPRMTIWDTTTFSAFKGYVTN